MKRVYMPVLMGKLGTSVSGPEGLPRFDGDAWDCVDWRRQEEQVRRLRGRIFKAVQDGDWPSARSLQKLMLRSWANTPARSAHTIPSTHPGVSNVSMRSKPLTARCFEHGAR